MGVVKWEWSGGRGQVGVVRWEGPSGSGQVGVVRKINKQVTLSNKYTKCVISRH